MNTHSRGNCDRLAGSFARLIPFFSGRTRHTSMERRPHDSTAVGAAAAALDQLESMDLSAADRARVDWLIGTPSAQRKFSSEPIVAEAIERARALNRSESIALV